MLGETIGNFRITARLGHGGMGEVFLAHQTSIDTPVAIKLLRPEVSMEGEHVQRFFNEARAANRIKHPGIVRIFDVGVHVASNRAYLVMEYLEGETLRARLARGPLTPLELGEIGRQAARVLEATHAAGITHRDLKPDNMFLVPDDELAPHPRVKIVDFGIAKLTGTIGVGGPRTVGMMGTPDYMAPEQWGDASKVDGRADVYALGCVVFELACGRPPFVSSTYAEACAKHLTQAAPRAASLATVPAALDELLARMLAKDPAARPSLREVVGTLGMLAGRPRADDSTPLPRASASAVAPSSPPSEVPPTVPPTVTPASLPVAPPVEAMTPRPATRAPEPANRVVATAPHTARARGPWLAAGAGGVALVAVIMTLAARSGTVDEPRDAGPAVTTPSDAPASPDAAPRTVAGVLGELAADPTPALLAELRTTLGERLGVNLALARTIVLAPTTPEPELVRQLERLEPETIVVFRAGRYVVNTTLQIKTSNVVLAGEPGVEIYSPSGTAVMRVKDARGVVVHGLYLNHHALDVTDWRSVFADMVCESHEYFVPVVQRSNVLELERAELTLDASELEGSGFVGLLAKDSRVVVRDSKIHDCISEAVRLERSRLVARDLLVYDVGNREYLATSGREITHFGPLCTGPAVEVCRRGRCSKLPSCSASRAAQIWTDSARCADDGCTRRRGGLDVSPTRFVTAFHVDGTSELELERLTLRVPAPLAGGRAFDVQGTLVLRDSVIDHRELVQLGKTGRATVERSCATPKTVAANAVVSELQLGQALRFRAPVGADLAFDGTLEPPACPGRGARLDDPTIRKRIKPRATPR